MEKVQKPMRLDKFLKVSRILKRRSVANEAAKGGKIFVNGKEAKPSHTMKEGDIISMRMGGKDLFFKVKMIKFSVKKADAESIYEVISE